MSINNAKREGVNGGAGVAGVPVVDADVHEELKSAKDLLPFLDSHWQRYVTEYGWAGVKDSLPYHPPTPGGNTRRDWHLADGTRGTDLAHMRRHLFENEGVQLAVLNGMFHLSAAQGWYEFAAAVAAAYNDWQAAEWLDKEPRLRGSVHVVAHDPVAAAREIDRSAAHPQIIQVFLPVVVDRQYGDPYYRPIFEAAVRNGLTVTLHHGGHTQTVLGYPRTFIEWHTAVPHAMMCQLASIICNGVLEEFPTLKIVCLETGCSWIPHFMFRLDQQFRGLRVEVPWVKRLPSVQMREQVRVGIQPFDELSARHFLQMIDMIGSEGMLLMATDYPHYDADSPLQVLPGGLPRELITRIRFQNALGTYARLDQADLLRDREHISSP